MTIELQSDVRSGGAIWWILTGWKAWCGWLGRWCVRWLLTAGPVVR